MALRKQEKTRSRKRKGGHLAKDGEGKIAIARPFSPDAPPWGRSNATVSFTDLASNSSLLWTALDKDGASGDASMMTLINSPSLAPQTSAPGRGCYKSKF